MFTSIIGIINKPKIYSIIFWLISIVIFCILIIQNSKFLINNYWFLNIDYPLFFIGIIIFYFCLYLIDPKRFINILEKLKKLKILYLVLLIISSSLFVIKIFSEILDQKYISNFLVFFLLFLGLSLWSYWDNIINIFKKIRFKKYLWLILILIVGLIIRLIGAYYANANLDEGNWIYDAWMIAEGLTPFKDFFSREPIYFYFTAPFVKLFGTSLFINRIFSAILSTITIVFVYLIGNKIKNEKVGLISALIFAITPAVVFASWDVGNGPAFYLLTSIIFYLFLLFLAKPKLWLAGLIGLLFGISIHFSRLAIFYYIIFPYIFVFYLIPKTKIKQVIGNYLFFWIVSGLGLIPLMLYYVNLIGWDAFDVAYGFTALLKGYAAGLVLFFIYLIIGKFIYPNKKIWNILKLIIILGIILFSIYSFFTIGIPYSYKFRIIYNIFMQVTFLFLPIFLLLFNFIKNNIKNKKISWSIIGVSSFLLFLLNYYGFHLEQNLRIFSTRPIPNNYEACYWLIFALLIFLFINLIYKKIDIKITKNSLLFPLLLLFLTPLSFYLIHVQINVSNFKSFIVLGSVLCGYIIYKLHHHRLFMICLILLFFLNAGFYLQTDIRDRLWSQKLISDVVQDIKANTRPNEEIYAAGTIFATEAHRRIALDISHPLIYGDEHVDMANYEGLDSVPTPQEIADYLEDNVNYIVMDHRTKMLFENNEELKKLQEDGVFKKTKKIDIINIFEKSPPSSD
ncbi:MAG: glycosyltransferase family 39 protein [Patescibacteria group bacterium]